MNCFFYLLNQDKSILIGKTEISPFKLSIVHLYPINFNELPKEGDK